MTEIGYIWDCCLKEIPFHEYDAHRKACFNEHYQLIDTRAETLKVLIKQPIATSKEPTRFKDSRLTLIEVKK